MTSAVLAHDASVPVRRHARIDDANKLAGSPLWAWVVTVAAVAASIAAVVIARRAGAVGWYGDEASHLLHARRVFDAPTPGFGQIGQYWPPLFQILELPLVWIDPLYRSGWAATIPAMGCYIAACLGAYALGTELLQDRRAGAVAALALGASPNMLYLQTTAMMEPAIVMALVWAAFGLARFARTGRFRDVVLAGALGSLATMAHYGAWLLPVYGAAVIAIACRKHGFDWRQTETFAVAYAVAAGYFVVVWLGWNFYLQHDPLYFAHYHMPVTEESLDSAFTHGRPGNAAYATLTFGLAVWHVLGPVATALIVAVLIAAFARRHFVAPAGATLAAVGFAVTFITLRGGSIGSPTLASLAHLTSGASKSDNIRYGLWAAPFLAAAAALVAGRKVWRQVLVAIALVAGLAWFLPTANGLNTLPRRDQRIGLSYEKQAAALIQQNYRGGEVLISSINGGDRIIWRTGMHASDFITEFSPKLFTHARRDPARYAQMVVLAPRSALELSSQQLAELGFRQVAYFDAYNDVNFRFSVWQRGEV